MENKDAPITLDDIIEDILAAQETSEEDGYMTAQEIADSLGIGLKKAQKMIRKAVHSGKLIVKKQRIIDVVGRWNYTFKYGPKLR